jgi:hypothetical protein
MDGEENVVQVVDFGIDRFDGFGSTMDSKDSFLNAMFEKNYLSIRISWIPFFYVALLR